MCFLVLNFTRHYLSVFRHFVTFFNAHLAAVSQMNRDLISFFDVLHQSKIIYLCSILFFGLIESQAHQMFAVRHFSPINRFDCIQIWIKQDQIFAPRKSPFYNHKHSSRSLVFKGIIQAILHKVKQNNKKDTYNQ